MILGSGLIQAASSWPTASDWLIRDDFTDTRAAGSVNGTAATPGPGTRAVTDTSSLVSVASGLLSMSGKNVVYTDPIVGYGSIIRATGVAMICRMTYTSGTNAVFGFQNKLMFKANSAAQLWCLDNSAGSGSSPVFSTSYSGSRFALILLSSGGLFFQDNTLLWIGRASTGNSAPIVATYDVDFDFDYLHCIALPAPFDSDDGLATDTHGGSVAAGTTFTHEADCIIEATLTTRPTAGNADIIFRQQDASNYWICRVNSSGDISLQEVVAGTPTQRSVAAGVVSSGHRVVVIAEGTTIKGFSNNALRWTYSSASNFATATAGEVDALGLVGAVSDVKSWPRTLSGTAAAILDKASA